MPCQGKTKTGEPCRVSCKGSFCRFHVAQAAGGAAENENENVPALPPKTFKTIQVGDRLFFLNRNSNRNVYNRRNNGTVGGLAGKLRVSRRRNSNWSTNVANNHNNFRNNLGELSTPKTSRRGAAPAIEYNTYPANAIEPIIAQNLTTEELAEREGLLPKGALQPAKNNNNEPGRTRKNRRQ
jgi:hypothetical protein